MIEEAERYDAEPQREGYGRPGEEECGRGVVVALIRKGAAIPLVPLVSQSAVYIYMYELSAGTVSHSGRT
jgi:hypothetical protein